MVCRSGCPNRCLGLDPLHIVAVKTSLAAINYPNPSKIFQVQLAAFMWQETKTFKERLSTARTLLCLPG